MRRLSALLVALAIAPAAWAQDWATRELCFADPMPVTADDFLPHDLAALEDQAAQIANARGKYWRIEHPGGGTSYLWGTMHVSLPKVLDLPEAVRTGIAEARLVALEVDYTYPDRATMIERYDTPGRFREPSDAFLPEEALDLSFLGPEVEAAVLDRLGGDLYGEEALYLYTYAGLAEFVLSDPCEDFMAGVVPHQDSHIQTLAHIAGAEILGLEDPDAFVSDLADRPNIAKAIVAVYAAFLLPPERLENFNGFAQLYLEGRMGLMAAWEAAYLQGVYGAAGLEALKLTDGYLVGFRNGRFLSRLAPELETGGVFAAVGAAHLSGERGLVRMLRDQGFKVTRVVLPGEVE